MPIKDQIKHRINSGEIDATTLIDQVKDYKIVSFDIFDTLLKRNVGRPSDVFSVMEYANSDLMGFKNARIFAEQEARKESQYEEVTLNEIYCKIRETGFKGKVLPEDELQAENSVLTVNKPLKEVFDYCVSSGKDVYIISDIYLPYDFIKKILGTRGYRGYKKMYISSVSRKTKKTGALYDIVLTENSIAPSDLVHIGDSIESDYMVPRKRGIKAVHIPTHVTGMTIYKHKKDSLESACLAALISNSIEKGDEYYHFGYECFGPFLWGFSRWLINNCHDKGIKHVFFFSRDGWILKRAFDIVNKDTTLISSYLEVSRRSLRVPTLWMDCEFDSVLKMVGAKLIPIVAIFDGVGLDINDYLELLQRYGLNKESIFDRRNVTANENLRAMYEELKPDIVTVSKIEYENLKGYIEQNHLRGKFAIVDIGWSGSMQRYLLQTLNKMGIECDIYGYYTGIASFYKRNIDVVPDMKMNGYLFDFMNDKNAHDIRSCFVGLFETIFLERDGSVKNYKKERGSYQATRYDYEYVIDGKPSQEILCVQQIQEAALRFIREIISVNIWEKKFLYSAKELFANIYEVGVQPQKRDLRMFAEFRFFDEGKVLYLAKPQKIFYYILHANELKSDFLLSRWKTGFLRALFKVPLDYNKVYEFMLRYK